MITIATLLWKANGKSQSFSSMYDESWAEKLYRGFRRNLTKDFHFVCFTDSPRTFREPILQRSLRSDVPGYGDCIQPYELGVPMILVGLDTIVCGNCDDLAAYAMAGNRFALPRDPYAPERACNGVALVPRGLERLAWEHNGENDMEWVRREPHAFIDDLFPGQVVSWKGRVSKHGLGDARIVYFHGEQKPHQLNNELTRNHWR